MSNEDNISALLTTFLYESSKILPKNDAGNFIRFHLIEKCRSVRNVNLPAQNFKSTVMCRTCGVQLTEVPPKIVLKKAKTPTRLVRKLLKVEATKLNAFQKKLLERYKKKGQQKLVTVCRVCNKKTVETVAKPVVKSVEDLNEVKKKKKKGKKKDVFSGLNKQAVLSVTKKQGIKKLVNKNTSIITDFQRKIKTKTKNVPKNQKGKKKYIREKNVVLSQYVEQDKTVQNRQKISGLLQQKATKSSSSLSDFLKNL